MIQAKHASDMQDLLEQAIRQDEESWLIAAEKDALRFLNENENADWTVIYACFEHIFLHTVLAPEAPIREAADSRDLIDRYPAPKDCWRVNYVLTAQEDDPHIFLEDPMSSSPLLRGGEKLVFQRRWEGDGDAPTRTEINQRLVHCLELFYVEERGAFCRLDENGDFEEVIRIIRVDIDGFRPNTVVAIRRQALHEYAVLANMAIVTHFDFNRYGSGHDHWSNANRFKKDSDRHLFYEGGVQREGGMGSFVIGKHIVIPSIERSEIARRLVAGDQGGSDQGYVDFKFKELKSGKVMRASCEPSKLSSYFQPESELPHQLSAAFFRAEVLSKYKADTEKYRFTDHGEIYCRDSWRLRSHYVNDADQVHAYLVDLNKLPYQEQIYWLAFNEEPKGGLARRAIVNDFEGEVDQDYDPIHSLKLRVEELDSDPPCWWKPRGDELRRVIHPPVTDSVDGWAEAILSLDKLIVEGLITKALRGRLEGLGGSFEKNWGSLKLLQECLIGQGMSEDEANELVGPLKLLHRLRTVLKGHAALRARNEEAKNARKEFGSFRNQYQELVADCDSAFASITSLLRPTD